MPLAQALGQEGGLLGRVGSALIALHHAPPMLECREMTQTPILRDFQTLLQKGPPPAQPSYPTFALGHRSGAVEVSGGVARAGNAKVLPEIGLVAAQGAADAAVHAGVVVVPGGALHWGEQRAKGAVLAISMALLHAHLFRGQP